MSWYRKAAVSLVGAFIASSLYAGHGQGIDEQQVEPNRGEEQEAAAATSAILVVHPDLSYEFLPGSARKRNDEKMLAHDTQPAYGIVISKSEQDPYVFAVWHNYRRSHQAKLMCAHTCCGQGHSADGWGDIEFIKRAKHGREPQVFTQEDIAWVLAHVQSTPHKDGNDAYKSWREYAGRYHETKLEKMKAVVTQDSPQINGYKIAASSNRKALGLWACHKHFGVPSDELALPNFTAQVAYDDENFWHVDAIFPVKFKDLVKSDAAETMILVDAQGQSQLVESNAAVKMVSALCSSLKASRSRL